MPKIEGREAKVYNFRLTEDCRELLRLLARAEGVNDTAFIEVTIRQLARERKIALPEKKDPTDG